MPPPNDSPRFQLVVANAAALVDLAGSVGVADIDLVGSVARGTDHDLDENGRASDIDFYVHNFPAVFNDEGTLERSQRLERAFEALLPGYKIKICGTPQRPVDGEFLSSMKRDAVSLKGLL